MIWAMELSPAGFTELLTDLSWMSNKTGRAFLKLMAYLRRFGSAPSGEKALADIMGVTPRYLQEVVWPQMEIRLDLSEDGKRYFDPDITAPRPRRAARGPAPEEKEKATQQQEAARAMWAKRRAAGRAQTEAHADGDAEAHASACEPHAETHVFSMGGACGPASDSASGASDASHAPSLSLASLTSFASLEIQPDSKEGREGEGARVDAQAHAAAHAESCEPDAQTHAGTHAEPHALSMRATSGSPASEQPKASRAKTPMTPDWKPSPAGEQEARKRGYDPEDLAEGFRNHYLANGERRADWDASFLNWCRKEAQFAGNRGSGAPRKAPGGRMGYLADYFGMGGGKTIDHS